MSISENNFENLFSYINAYIAESDLSAPAPAPAVEALGVYYLVSLTGVALSPTSIYASASKHFFRGSLNILESSSEYSLKFKSASPKMPLSLSPDIVNFDYIK